MPTDLPSHWPHQLTARERMENERAFYLAMEQRTGKTRPIIEESDDLFLKNIIDALLIVAMPSGAPFNWVRDEIPLWGNPAIPRMTYLWRADKIKNKGEQRKLQELIDFKGLAVLAVNGEATSTEAFKAYISKFMRKRRVYTAGDEATLLLGKPGNKRTRVMYAIGKLSLYRRLLDGTPGEDPMDFFPQYWFLDPNIIGQGSFFSFKARYAELEKGYNHTTGTEYTTIKKGEDGQPIYRNLNELQTLIAPYTFRVRFNDVFPDTARPVYQKRRFDLVPKQRAAYDQLEAEYEIELQSLGTVTVAHVLTRYLRLQQITSGFWPASKVAALCDQCDGAGCEECDNLGAKEQTLPLTRIIPYEENPRVEALKQELIQSKAPGIVWCRFNQDAEDISQACRELGRVSVRYDGSVDQEHKFMAKDAFQTGRADVFISKPRSAGRAVRLDAAEWMLYYSNYYGAKTRLQSEDRPKVAGRKIATQIIDAVANDTKDEDIIAALRAGRSVADIILKEDSGKWL